MNIELKEGEIYVGRINDEHIILLPGDMSMQKQSATENGGNTCEIPKRIYQRA